MTDYELMKLFDSLDGGIAFASDLKLATFTNPASAHEFKIAAPNWTVQIARL